MFGLGNIVGSIVGGVTGLVGGLAKTGVGAVTTVVSSTVQGAVKAGASSSPLPELLQGASTTLTPLGKAVGPASASTTAITASNGDTELDSHFRQAAIAVFGLAAFVLPIPGFVKGVIVGPGVALAMMVEHKVTHHPPAVSTAQGDSHGHTPGWSSPTGEPAATY